MPDNGSQYELLSVMLATTAMYVPFMDAHFKASTGDSEILLIIGM